MDIDKNLIDNLRVEEDSLIRSIGEKLGLRGDQAAAVAALLNEGCTVPFIARYRKEKTGGLDEVRVREIERLYNAAKNLEGRRIEIIRGIFNQGKLSAALYGNIREAATAAELEDLYAPYRRKKKTRGMLALERGLGPLAEAMKTLEAPALLALAEEFAASYTGGLGAEGGPALPPGRGVAEDQAEGDSPAGPPESGDSPSQAGGGSADPGGSAGLERGGLSPLIDNESQSPAPFTAEDALRGAMDIIAEEISQDPGNRAVVKALYRKGGRISVKASGVKGKGDEEAKKTSTYQMYWDYGEELSRIKAHRILAINRGEREGVLSVAIDVDEAAAVRLLLEKYGPRNEYHEKAVEDGLRRLLSPAVIREIRGDQKDEADDHGVSVFAENLKNLLMQRPIKGKRVLGIDPGIRTGTKCVCLDDTGKYLGNFVIYHHRVEEAKRLLLQGIKQYDVQLVAVGNGTGSHEAQELVSQVIGENNLELLYTVVDEDGASVYSASDIAREEFPDLDLTIRGAVSIGRRLQDPLAELVKIDPKSVGVGLYQHDLNQKKLSETLDEVVSSVVNNVGVNLNTASFSLLKYVSGINSGLAKTIVRYRGEKGRIESRAELVSISGMGPKSFEQCAGFLKIPESAEPLDNTWVHPENYPLAREIRAILSAAGVPDLPPEAVAELKEKHGAGDATIADITGELKRPGRDPREGYAKPVARKDVLRFEDLKEGTLVTGKIKNVVDFGAFVDLGIKETALVHISELSGHFVKDPLGLVKVGDVLEFKIISLDQERRRIGLSRKLGQDRPAGKRPPETGNSGAEENGEKTASPRSARRSQGPAHHDTGERRPAGEYRPAVPPRRGETPAAFPPGDRAVPRPERGPRPAGEYRPAGEHRPTGEHRPMGERRGAGEHRPTGEHRPMGERRGAGGPVPSYGPSRPGPFRSPAEDDGAMYNPFAEALRKMEERAARDKDKKKH
ncbi:MAG: helix-hairpin-helix domain-containing protein [Treponema sp.]|jgi:uncharacterized protein|nr:helix-hairpin-helix domain-containing protein [Treponema sp.]